MEGVKTVATVAVFLVASVVPFVLLKPVIGDPVIGFGLWMAWTVGLIWVLEAVQRVR